MSRIYEHANIDRIEIWLIVDGERIQEIGVHKPAGVAKIFDDACRNNPNAEVCVREEQHVVEWTDTHYREA